MSTALRASIATPLSLNLVGLLQDPLERGHAPVPHIGVIVESEQRDYGLSLSGRNFKKVAGFPH
jgi:hypothetical protein